MNTERRDDRRRWLALYVLCAGVLMIVLDATIVNVALPSIQDDLGFSQSNLAWVVNAYLIAFGGLLLLAGRLGDLIGQRRDLPDRPGGLHAASLLCALAQSQGMLIGARFVQGVGGALTSAVILGMIVTMFPEPREQAKAIGVYGFVASAGGSIGLLAGGVADRGDQLALDLLRQRADRHRDRAARAAAGRARDPGIGLKAGRRPARRRAAHRRADARRLHDPRGRASRAGARRRRSGSARVALALLAAFVARQARIANPLMPLRLFHSRNVAGREHGPGAARRRACSGCSSSARSTCSGSSATTRSRSASRSCPSTIVDGRDVAALLRAR